MTSKEQLKAKKLVLDYSTWRCGGDGQNRLGDGPTSLYNKKGYACCLGQWCIHEGAPVELILNKDEPIDVYTDEHEDEKYFEETHLLRHSDFVASAIGINDDEETSPNEKAEALVALTKKYGYDLKLINFNP